MIDRIAERILDWLDSFGTETQLRLQPVCSRPSQIFRNGERCPSRSRDLSPRRFHHYHEDLLM